MVGYIIRRNDGFFYNGLGQFKKDIRDAKIYHTEKGALDTMNYRFANIGVQIITVRISIAGGD